MKITSQDTPDALDHVTMCISDIGRASGLEAAAQVLLAMADHKRRVVGTGELKAAAIALQESAAVIRAQAKSRLDKIEHDTRP